MTVDTKSDELVAESLSVRFGGLVALNGVDLRAPIGRITGLIGPNGAGKTTFFNACTGVVRPTEGRVRLFGEDVTSLQPSDRAQLGLGRTFQRIELFNSLSVRENVALGREAGLAGGSVLRQFLSRRHERSAALEAADRELERCGILHLANQRAGDLSTGQRRLVELARLLAGDFRLLLLDEPSSGLDNSETDRFGELVCGVIDNGDVGVLLVEHDMSLVMQICKYLYVLDFGKLIFDGTPEETAKSDTVREAYLGASEGDHAGTA
jgi:ABC-type branched-subunit amino acid transport system ATPase component